MFEDHLVHIEAIHQVHDYEKFALIAADAHECNDVGMPKLSIVCEIYILFLPFL